VRIGRYDLFDQIASGGVGTVHLGRVRADAGFSRIVAIKRLNPLFAKDPDFLRMFLDEARLAMRVSHPNVVPTFDVIEANGEVLLVMEYVQGEALGRLLSATRNRGGAVAPSVAVAVMSDALYGLHAAHEAVDERGQALGLVHRDVSPQNVLVGIDGVARVIDFGVAKATGRLQTTSHGELKGKLAYMSPEQLGGKRLDRRADIFSAGVVLWELLVGGRLFQGETPEDTFRKVLLTEVQAPSKLRPELPVSLDAVVLRALSPQPSDRFSSAREMAAELRKAAPAAAPHEVGEWVEASAYEALAARQSRVAELESSSIISVPAPTPAADADVPSVSAARPVTPRSRAGRAWALGALVVAVAGGWQLRFKSRPDPLGLAASPSAITAAPPTSNELVIPPSNASAPAPERPSTTLDGATDSVASVASAASTNRPRAPAPHPSPPVATHAPSSPDCAVPYTIGDDSVRHWKRECLR
jgi:serine/threonine-protein kinase